MDYMLDNYKPWKVILAFIIIISSCLLFLFSILHPNLQLDAAEILFWSKEWQWGGHKHPSLPAWFLQVFLQVLPNNMVSYYFVGQVTLATTFLFVWLLAREILEPVQAMLATIILASAIFYSFYSLTYNANTLSLLTWAAFNFCLWKSFNNKHWGWWGALALAASAAILSKYAATMLFLAATTTMIVVPEWRKLFKTYKPYMAIAIVLGVTMPHWIWVAENNYTTILYATRQFSADEAFVRAPFLPSVYFSLRFAYGQVYNMLPVLLSFAVLMPFFVPWHRKKSQKNKVIKNSATNSLINSLKQINKKEIKVFLLIMGLMPFGLSILISVILGKYLHSLWGLFYWNLAGISLFYFFGDKIIWTRLRAFFAVWAFFVIATTLGFLMILFFVPTLQRGQTSQKNYTENYTETSTKRETRRVSVYANRRLIPYFDGEYMAKLLEKKWRESGFSKLEIVGGHQWLAGNVSFFSDARPSVFEDLDITKSAWMSFEELAEKGGIVLWHAKQKQQHDAGGMPVKYQQALQGINYEIQEPISVPWRRILGFEPRRVQGLPMSVVEWAIVPPQ